MDRVRRFIFEHRPVRGHWVNLTDAWRALHAHGRYPAPVLELLGEAVAASVLLAATLKFRGTLTLQLQGDGALRLLVAQCTHDFRVRAVARFDPEAIGALTESTAHAGRFAAFTGQAGRITVTLEAQAGRLRYQGVVPLSGSSLAQSLEAYFASSEQVPTRVQLAADPEHAGGMLVQKLPDEGAGDPEQIAAAWEAAQRGISRLQRPRLLEGSVGPLLPQLFPGRDLRLFRGSPVRFECRCSPARVTGLLRALGAQEVRDALRQEGAVTVTCEFCHRPYRFDPVDVEALFCEPRPGHPSASLH
jgi:molecular chaperone Hsp33